MPGRDMTYVAQWIPNQYTTTFIYNSGVDENGGTENRVVTQNYGSTMVLPTLVRVGYVFEGWDPEVPEFKSDENTEHQALWSPAPVTATFDANGGDEVSEETRDYYYKDELGELPTATKIGYHFIGWFLEPEGIDQVTEETLIEGDTTYYAKWA